MVRPVAFGFNQQTSSTNSFQTNDSNLDANEIQKRALLEFDSFVRLLKENDVNVIVHQDTTLPPTPDSIFPNNVFSSHKGGTFVIHSMLAENRRLERNKFNTFDFLTKKRIIDLSVNEEKNIFLEGTGSIVFDYLNKIAYASLSPRTNRELFEHLCVKLQFKPISFVTTDYSGQEIYHTNVVLCIGNNFAIICKECFRDLSELNLVLESLHKTNHEIIFINSIQLNSFAGNTYQLFNRHGHSLIVMSEQAAYSLERDQLNKLLNFGKLLTPILYTIEQYGGGSARCMMAEIFE